MTVTNIVPAHQAIYDSIPDGLRNHFYIHKMWSGVSCIRLVKGGYKSLIEAGKAAFGTTNHALILSLAETEILRVADVTSEGKVWSCARRVLKGSDGVEYVGVFVFLGTSNYEEFLKESAAKRSTQEVSHV